MGHSNNPSIQYSIPHDSIVLVTSFQLFLTNQIINCLTKDNGKILKADLESFHEIRLALK